MKGLDGILQAVLALLAAVGLLALGWTLFGWLLAPSEGDGPVYAVVPAAGEGAHLGQDDQRLLWLRGQQKEGFTIVIAGGGVGPAGRAVAAALLTGATGVVVCPAERLGEYITEK